MSRAVLGASGASEPRNRAAYVWKSRLLYAGLYAGDCDGNAYSPGKKVTLAFERTARDLVITICDQGAGLDASKIPDPLAPENLMKTSGRGIFLIRSFMDVVEIHPSQSGTELKMIKHVHGSAADSKEASQ